MNNENYVFAVFVKKTPIEAGKTTREKIAAKTIKKGQNYMFNSIFKNLGDAKAPVEETEGCVYFIDTKEKCIQNEKEFWETGTVDVIDQAKKNIQAQRYPAWVRKSLSKIVDKNAKINDIFRMFTGYFQVVVTTKTDTLENFMPNKDNASYFLTSQKPTIKGTEKEDRA